MGQYLGEAEMLLFVIQGCVHVGDTRLMHMPMMTIPLLNGYEG